jgi:hypothetical protein
MERAYHWSWPRITLAIGLRVLLVTFLLTLAAFAAGLFAGILVLMARSLRSGQADFTAAYIYFAIPFALLGMFAGLVGMLVIEIRQLRRPRARPALRLR